MRWICSGGEWAFRGRWKRALDLVGTEDVHVAGFGSFDAPAGEGEDSVYGHGFTGRGGEPLGNGRGSAAGLLDEGSVEPRRSLQDNTIGVDRGTLETLDGGALSWRLRLDHVDSGRSDQDVIDVEAVEGHIVKHLEAGGEQLIELFTHHAFAHESKTIIPELSLDSPKLSAGPGGRAQSDGAQYGDDDPFVRCGLVHAKHRGTKADESGDRQRLIELVAQRVDLHAQGFARRAQGQLGERVECILFEAPLAPMKAPANGRERQGEEDRENRTAKYRRYHN